MSGGKNQGYVEKLKKQLAEMRQANAELQRQVAAFELDVRRKEIVFELFNALLDASGAVADAANVYRQAPNPDNEKALDESLAYFHGEGSKRFEEGLADVERVFAVASMNPSAAIQGLREMEQADRS